MSASTSPFAWYLQRFRKMPPQEWPYRVSQLLQTHRLRRYRAPETLPDLQFCSASEPILRKQPWDREALAADAEGLLNGRWDALHCPWRFGGTSFDQRGYGWHRAPDTVKFWPVRFYDVIDYRPGNNTGDVRVVWEPSRLQQLPTLAALADQVPQTEADRAIALLERQLVSWMRANPPYRGVHYVSAMECGLRLIAVCHALDMARQRIRHQNTWRVFTELVVSHAALIRKRLSLYSSSGNHTIAEGVALLYAARLFPELKLDAERVLVMLRREADRQILPDGGGIERSLAYTRFVVDLLQLAATLESDTHARDGILNQAVARGTRFLAECSGLDEAFGPGDSDGSHALSRYLQRDAVIAHPAPVLTFPEFGMTRLCAGRDTQVLLDHGPLGMAPNAAHGHADALHLDLYHHTVALLSDTGTGAYGGDLEIRNYFRSTAAHNTVTVDGRSQAQSVGAFLWSRPYHCELIESRSMLGGTMLIGRHDGYGEVRHWRAIWFDHRSQLIVVDGVFGNGKVESVLRWHAGTAIDVAALADRPDSFVLHGPADVQAQLQVSGAHRVVLHSAGEHSDGQVGGWCSPFYGRRLPTTVMCFERCDALPHWYETTVFLPVPGESCDSLIPGNPEVVSSLRLALHERYRNDAAR